MPDLVKLTEDFEAEADKLIDDYFEEHHPTTKPELVTNWEKKLIIKQLALANSRKEIVRKINVLRKEEGLPELNLQFDTHYYRVKYSALIEIVSVHYARNIAKIYRFANRLTRIGKLNEIAEGVLERIRDRDDLAKDGQLGPAKERLHNENIKLFLALIDGLDKNMGHLRPTKADSVVKRVEANQVDIKKSIEGFLRRNSDRLPIDATFTEVKN
jgi:hypothetical protein